LKILPGFHETAFFIFSKRKNLGKLGKVFGVMMFYPCLFCPSDNVWHSPCADAPRRTDFSTVITPSCITQQISVEKCAHRGASARRERQTMFKIVTWTKQTWRKHHDTNFFEILLSQVNILFLKKKWCFKQHVLKMLRKF